MSISAPHDLSGTKHLGLHVVAGMDPWHSFSMARYTVGAVVPLHMSLLADERGSYFTGSRTRRTRGMRKVCKDRLIYV